MYSVVLATMLVAGGTTPDWHHHRGYSSCYGCTGYVAYNSCHGCYGGWYTGHHHHRSYYSGCYGCCGGSFAYSSCYGCCGGSIAYSSCYGCCGGSYAYSSCYGCCGGSVVYSSCYGCCGGTVVVPSVPQVVPVPVVPKAALPVYTQPIANAAPVAAPTQGDTQRVAYTNQASQTTARVTVLLPASARLWVDHVECPLTSNVRSFNTPVLNPNQQYYYNLRMEVVRDGRSVTENQRVLITPGRETRVDFNASADSSLRTVSR